MSAKAPGRLGPFEADTAVLRALNAGRRTFAAIVEHAFGPPRLNGAYAGDWRAIDRAIQRLRKEGTIRRVRVTKEWEVVS